MILQRFRPTQARSIRDLYGVIVAQARRPGFYLHFGVPDTVDGRFDLIVLHIVLVLTRLSRGEASRDIGQDLFDVFCSDLDANLREMGVGDLAVPKRMRAFGEAFYGRQAAYAAAFAAADPRALEKALARNIFQSEEVDARARRLADYVGAALGGLETQEERALLRGEATFPAVEAKIEAVANR